MVAAVFIYQYKNCLTAAFHLRASRFGGQSPPPACRLLPAASPHLPGPETGVGAGILFGSFT